MLKDLSASNGLFLISLLALFAFSVTLPVAVALKVGGFIWSTNISSSEDLAKESVFPQAVSIADANNYLRVTSSPALEPLEGKDFLLTAWFKFRKFPALGERMMIIMKYD